MSLMLYCWSCKTVCFDYRDGDRADPAHCRFDCALGGCRKSGVTEYIDRKCNCCIIKERLVQSHLFFLFFQSAMLVKQPRL